MTDDKEQKEAIKKDVQELEAKILLNNLKEEQKALDELEESYRSPWSFVWAILFVGIGVYLIGEAHNNLQIAAGTICVMGGLFGSLFGTTSFVIERRLKAIRYLILKMRKEISDLKANLR
jgi:hypothetical protein